MTGSVRLYLYPSEITITCASPAALLSLLWYMILYTHTHTCSDTHTHHFMIHLYTHTHTYTLSLSLSLSLYTTTEKRMPWRNQPDYSELILYSYRLKATALHVHVVQSPYIALEKLPFPVTSHVKMFCCVYTSDSFLSSVPPPSHHLSL